MSTPDEMLREAERAKDANPCPETWQRLAEVRDRVGWKSPGQIEREHLNKLMKENIHPNKEIAVLLGTHGGALWSGSYVDETVERWAVNGKCKTWATEPTHFKLPLKFGFYGPYGYLTHHNCGGFLTAGPTKPLRVTVRRVELRGDYVKENVLGIAEGTYFGKGMKLWAFEVSSPDNIALPAPPEGSSLHGVPSTTSTDRLYCVRAADRDAVRILIRNHYRLAGLAVNFTQ